MKPTMLATRPRPRPVCQLCEYILLQPGHPRRFFAASALLSATPRRPRASNTAFVKTVATRPASASTKPVNSTRTSRPSAQNTSRASTELERAKKLVNAILNSELIPSEEETLAAFQACESAAHLLTNNDNNNNNNNTSRPTATPDSSNNPAFALLTLEPHPSISVAQIDQLSTLAHALLTHPPVFLTPPLLTSYVTTQSLLQRPSTLPSAFTLYATKPAPKPGTNPPQYRAAHPSAAAAAIPPPTASAALSAAITAKSLPLALDVIETSYRAPAFRRNKLLRRALPPFLGAALAPLAAYTVAARLALLQQTMEPGAATAVAFAGILTYVGATATIGVVAMTTANDQMDRVTWATGMPLRERWLREEERAAVDRVAGAWGFKESWRRGEEEGEEWEMLREWVGVRGMVLDRVELMEGME